MRMVVSATRQLRQLGAAVVGPGTIGEVHVEAIRRVGARIRVVVARTEAGAEAAREQYGAESATADFARALADPDVDVVHICTPNALHFSMASAALSAGKHVVLEKPFTISVPEGRELLDLAEKSGCVHAICFNTRFYPLVQEVYERVHRGDLGDVFAVRASVLEDGLLYASDWNWRLDLKLGGPSVALSTIGCHLIDLVSFMLGDAVSEVCADLRTVHHRRRMDTLDGREIEVDAQEVAHLLVRFQRGCRGLLAVSQAAAGRRLDLSVQLDGTKQALRWCAPDANELWVGHRDAPNQIILRDPALVSDRARGYVSEGPAFREGFAETFVQLVRHVYAAIVNGGPPDPAEAMYPTFHDGLAALCVHSAALDSARSGGWERVTY
jgi:predicted dehydrogenase